MNRDVRANRSAVANFLSSLCGDQRTDLRNLALDAYSYRWNDATVGAIKTGIMAHYAPRHSQEDA